MLQQLIAAKLNILQGADDTSIASRIGEADDLICAVIGSPLSAALPLNRQERPWGSLRNAFNTIKDDLGDWNNSRFDPGDPPACGSGGSGGSRGSGASGSGGS